MSDADESPPESGEIRQTAWREKAEKNAAYYTGLKTKYEEFIKGNEFLTIAEVLNVVNIRTISLPITNMKRSEIAVSRETTVNVSPRVLAKRSGP